MNFGEDRDSRGRFHALVDVALDERRDPLEDPAIQRLLAEDPRQLEELYRLERGLTYVKALSSSQGRERIRRGKLRRAATALMLAAVGVAWLGLSKDRGEPDRASDEDLRAHFTTNTGPSRVLSFEVELVHATQFERVTIARDGQRETVRREQLQDSRTSAPDNARVSDLRSPQHEGAAMAAPEPTLAVQEFVAVVSVGAITR